MSSSDEEASVQEETWDDMAIVRAFEAAMRGKRSAEKKQAAPSNGRNGARADRKTQVEQRRKQSVASHQTEDAGTPRGAGATQAQSHAEAPQSQDELYQAAYAHAYAQLQAQWQQQQPQAPPPAPVYANQHPGYGYGHEWAAQHHQPPVPPRMPFPSMPGGSTTAPPFPGAGLGQDDLANLLLSWYQSGYYTGRYQAMQEMQAKGFR